jgi:hypothetical protein
MIAGPPRATNAAAIKVPKKIMADSINNLIAPSLGKAGASPAVFQPSVRGEKVLRGQ